MSNKKATNKEHQDNIKKTKGLQKQNKIRYLWTKIQQKSYISRTKREQSYDKMGTTKEKHGQRRHWKQA